MRVQAVTNDLDAPFCVQSETFFPAKVSVYNPSTDKWTMITEYDKK